MWRPFFQKGCHRPLWVFCSLKKISTQLTYNLSRTTFMEPRIKYGCHRNQPFITHQLHVQKCPVIPYFPHFLGQGFKFYYQKCHKWNIYIAVHQYTTTLTADKHDWAGMNQPSTEYVIYSHYTLIDFLYQLYILHNFADRHLRPNRNNAFAFDIMTTYVLVNTTAQLQMISSMLTA